MDVDCVTAERYKVPTYLNYVGTRIAPPLQHLSRKDRRPRGVGPMGPACIDLILHLKFNINLFEKGKSIRFVATA